jgi:hypothetical protein
MFHGAEYLIGKLKKRAELSACRIGNSLSLLVNLCRFNAWANQLITTICQLVLQAFQSVSSLKNILANIFSYCTTLPTNIASSVGLSYIYK